MSTPRSLDGLLALALFACLAPAMATPDPSVAQREQIGRERQAVERETQQAQEACALQFAVTDCVNRAKARRRERMRPLDLELARVDEALRQQRATVRLAHIQQRQHAERHVPPKLAVRAPRVASEPLSSVPAVAVAVVPPRSVDGAAADAAAAQRTAASAYRADQAKAHRIAVEEKNRLRAAQREPAKSLPLPPGLAASR